MHHNVMSVAVPAVRLQLSPRAVHLREQGATIAQIVEKTGVPRASLYRHTPPRPAEAFTADGAAPAD